MSSALQAFRRMRVSRRRMWHLPAPQALRPNRWTACMWLPCALALSACAATGSAPVSSGGAGVHGDSPSPAQEHAAMNASSTTLDTPSGPTAQSLSERLIGFILAIEGMQDLTADGLRRGTGLPVQVNPADPNDYGINGRLTDTWYYGLRSMSPDAAERPNRVLFELSDQSGSDADMGPVCVPIEQFQQPLTAAGFSARKLRNRLDTQDYWEFTRGKVGVTVYVRGKRDPADAQTCVSMAIVEAYV